MAFSVRGMGLCWVGTIPRAVRPREYPGELSSCVDCCDPNRWETSQMADGKRILASRQWSVTHHREARAWWVAKDLLSASHRQAHPLAPDPSPTTQQTQTTPA